MIYTGYLNGEKFFDTSSDYDGYTVTAAQVELELGASGSASFGVPPVNIFYGNFNKLVDSVSVYRGSEEIFFGRVYGVSGELNTVHTVTCEGYLAVLNDSIFEPETYECSLEELVDAIIENHNEKCPDWPLEIGTLEFEDDYVYRAYEEYESSKSRLDDLVDSYGGYLVCRKEDDTVYLDWLDSDNTAEEGQEINFGENLLDITQESTADDIITALIPIGATVTEESDDEDEEDTEYTVDITSVNDGLNYIYDEDAVAKFGWIWDTYTWDDVEEPANLYAKAVAYLADQCDSKVTISVSAVDLSEAGYDYDSFNIGVKNPVVSSPHGIDESFLCSKLSINCLNRTSSSMELGGTRDGIVSTSSKNYAANASKIEKIEKNYATNSALSAVSQRVTQNYSLITQLSDYIGLYVSEDTTVGSTVIEELYSSIELTSSEILATVSSVAEYTSAQTGSNLLQDGGFEAADYWDDLPDGMYLDDSNPHSGTYSMACTSTTSNTAYLNHPYGSSAKSTYNLITVEPGETYRLTAYCMISDDAEFASNNTKIRIGDSSGSLIFGLDVSSATTEWAKLTYLWTNSNYTEIQIQLVQAVTSGTVWWDDIRFELDTATSDDVESAVSTATSTITTAYTSAISQSASEIAASVSETYLTITDAADSYATTSSVETMIRLTTDGVEVSRLEDGEYTSTRTVIDDAGLYITDSSGVELAAFQSDTIKLGENSEESTIEMCGGLCGIGNYSLDDETYTMLYTSADSGLRIQGVSKFPGESGYSSVCYFAIGQSGAELRNGRFYADNIQSGSVGITAAAGDTTTEDIEFDTEFSSMPKVFTQSTYCYSGTIHTYGGSRSTEGFTLSVYNSGSSDRSVTVLWFAIITG